MERTDAHPTSTDTPRDWLKLAALLFALTATASAEYELALAAGFNRYIAAAVPGALDVYVVRALRVHRDVAPAVAAMILVNAASHLVTARLLPVSVPIVVAVSAIAPLVLWRVHLLREAAPKAHPAVAPTPTEAPEQPLADLARQTLAAYQSLPAPPTAPVLVRGPRPRPNRIRGPHRAAARSSRPAYAAGPRNLGRNPGEPVTAKLAVLAAAAQLPQGATARDIAAHVAAAHALEVTPEAVRSIRSKHRREQAQPAAQPQQWAGGYA